MKSCSHWVPDGCPCKKMYIIRHFDWNTDNPLNHELYLRFMTMNPPALDPSWPAAGFALRSLFSHVGVPGLMLDSCNLLQLV